MVLAAFLVRIWHASSFGKVLAISLLGAYAVGIFHSFRIYRVGRGQFDAALRSTVIEHGTIPVLVTSDHDFRTELILEFFRQKRS